MGLGHVDLRRARLFRSQLQLALGRIVLSQQGRLAMPEDCCRQIFQPREIIVELQHRAPGCFAVARQVTTDHRMRARHAHQRQQRRPQVDLAGNCLDGLGLDFSPHDQPGMWRLVNRHQAVAVHPVVMIGNDQEHGIFPAILLLRFSDELAQRIVGVFHGMVDGLLDRVMQCDFPVREFERRMVR